MALDYERGIRLVALSAKYGLSQTTVWRRLQKSGVTMTRCTYRYDARYFAIIDSEVKAYFLGYLTTDGYVVEGPRRYVVTLTSTEPAIPRAFAAAVGGGIPVYEIAPSGRLSRRLSMEYRVSVCSKQMVADLVALGVRQAKSCREVFCEQVPKEFVRHYLRGIFDGDGSLGTYGYSGRPQHALSLVGSRAMLQRVAEVVAEVLDVPHANVRTKARNLCVVSWRGNNLVPRIVGWLYGDSTIALPRKRALASAMAATEARSWTTTHYGRRRCVQAEVSA
jgi:hypothetical protein